MTDRLSPTNALAAANIECQKAERIATEIFDAIHENVATKPNLQLVEAALKADGAAVRAELREVALRLEARIDRIVVRLHSLVMIRTGIILAAIRYLPHA